ncbi:universal stress protein [Marinobacter nauticus]|uniref:universal stress protein n=1 Tax=Marinobacter nauticus TaxID=2743 RepID=UPI002E28D6CE|nr:universal stress protein [Marinobacter nauticus]
MLLDGSRRSLAALEAAADIARAQQAEVLGIFVEEVSLLRSAGYGFAWEVGRSSGVAGPMDVDALEVRMQATAAKLRRTLERTLAPWGVAQALRLCRGEVVEQVLGLVQPDDLLVLGGAGWSGISSFRLGSTARSLLRQAPSGRREPHSW